MLETIAIILIILWLLAMVAGYTLGGLIWVLLILAAVLFLIRLVIGDIDGVAGAWSRAGVDNKFFFFLVIGCLALGAMLGPWAIVALFRLGALYSRYATWAWSFV